MHNPDRSDQAYWTRREREELARAGDGPLQSRVIHAELAARYAALIRQTMSPEPKEASMRRGDHKAKQTKSSEQAGEAAPRTFANRAC